MYQKIAFLINAISLTLLFSISILYYNVFEEAINDRVLNHLVSIKRLKRVQIENYILSKRDLLKSISQHKSKLLPDQDTYYALSNQPSLFYEGQKIPIKSYNGNMAIQDVSPYYANEDHILLYSFKTKGTTHVLISKLPELEKILTERTGMGQTGESYIVGSDLKMRSKSRFFHSDSSRKILVQTLGVQKALAGKSGTGIFNDYRHKTVFSAYHKLNIPGINWIILSEMDEEEAHAPIFRLKKQLILIAFFIAALGLAFSIWLSRFLVHPINKIKKQLAVMAKGQLPNYKPQKNVFDEVNEMNQTLVSLVQSMQAISAFAKALGNQEAAHFKLRSQEDNLGNALLEMQEKLRSYRAKELQLERIHQKTLWKGQEKERARLAKELHDGIGPLLTTLKMALQSDHTTDKQTIVELINTTITEVRRVSYNLMPQALFDFGIEAALKNFVSILQQVTQTKISFHFANEENHKSEDDLSITLYRIAQEAINNGIKHAQATHIHLDITIFSNEAHLYYKDDGVGFEQNTSPLGNGVLNMKERCKMMGGNFSLNSNHQGTSIEVDLPINHD